MGNTSSPFRPWLVKLPLKLHSAANLLLLLSSSLFGFSSCFGGSSIAVICGWIFAIALANFFSQVKKPDLVLLWLTGLLLYYSSGYWIVEVISQFTNCSFVTALSLSFVLFSLLALQFVFCGLLVRKIDRGWIARSNLALPISWLLLELFFPQFFPWRLATGQLAWQSFAIISSIAGLPFLSFVMLWVATRIVNRQLKQLATSLIVFTGMLILGDQMRHETEKTINQSPTLMIGMVQGNIPPEHNAITASNSERLERYQALSASLLKSQPRIELLLWPESSSGHDYPDNVKSITRGSIADPLPAFDVPLFFGGETLYQRYDDKSSNDRQYTQYFTSLRLLEPDGQISQRYDKEIRFPFVETMLPGWQYINPRHYQILRGDNKDAITLPLKESNLTNGLQIVPAICYEDLFDSIFVSQLTNHSVEGMPAVLVVASNESWFLSSAALKIHHGLAAWRAVETGKYLVRITNNGLSSVISPLGETVFTLPVNQEASGSYAVPLLRQRTLFSKISFTTIPSLLGALLISLFPIAISNRHETRGSLLKRKRRNRKDQA